MSQFNFRSAPLLFVDFDGVLHPSEVYIDKQGVAFLDWEGELFMWAPLLVDALTPFPDVRIILSTTWARRYGREGAAARLPDALRSRVVGSTRHQRASQRGREIENFVAVHSIEHSRWLAIDDDETGFREAARGNLVLCDPFEGLSRETTREDLERGLERLARRQEPPR